MSHILSRRGFLHTTSSLAAVAALSGVTRGLRAADSSAWGGWPIGVQSYSLREYNAHDAIRHIQGMGVHFVEFFTKHLELNATDEQIAETRKLLDAADIKLN